MEKEIDKIIDFCLECNDINEVNNRFYNENERFYKKVGRYYNDDLYDYFLKQASKKGISDAMFLYFKKKLQLYIIKVQNNEIIENIIEIEELDKLLSNYLKSNVIVDSFVEKSINDFIMIINKCNAIKNYQFEFINELNNEKLKNINCMGLSPKKINNVLIHSNKEYPGYGEKNYFRYDYYLENDCVVKYKVNRYKVFNGKENEWYEKKTKIEIWNVDDSTIPDFIQEKLKITR